MDAEPIVYVVDDDSSVRLALEDLFASVSLRVRSFASVQDFVARPADSGPACLVLDVRMPGQSGMDFHQQMGELGQHLPTVFITGHGDVAMGVQAMKNGAIDFLTKPFRDQDLLDAVQRGIELDRDQQKSRATEIAMQARWQQLTPGEREVAVLVVQGLLNKQIAAALSVSEITVKVRRRSLMDKLGIKALADLVRLHDRMHPPSA